jgi:hypothetical protein
MLRFADSARRAAACTICTPVRLRRFLEMGEA